MKDLNGRFENYDSLLKTIVKSRKVFLDLAKLRRTEESKIAGDVAALRLVSKKRYKRAKNQAIFDYSLVVLQWLLKLIEGEDTETEQTEDEGTKTEEAEDGNTEVDEAAPKEACWRRLLNFIMLFLEEDSEKIEGDGDDASKAEDEGAKTEQAEGGNTEVDEAAPKEACWRRLLDFIMSSEEDSIFSGSSSLDDMIKSRRTE